MKRHVNFSSWREMRLLFLSVFAFVFSLSVNGTNYTYAIEGFEDTGWPTSASSSAVSVETTTGTWSTVKFVQVTSSYAGTHSLKASSSGTSYYIQSPYLSNGADVVSFYMYSTGTSSRTITVLYSTDGTNWTSAGTASPTAKNTWELKSVTVGKSAATYIRLSGPTNSDLQFDNVLITASTIKLATPSVGSPTLATSSGFTANWSTVTNASGYSVKVYKGTTLITTVSVSSGTSTSSVISGLTPDSTYNYTVTAVGDNITYSNSDESSASSSIRVINTDASITSFILLGGSGTIDQTANTIDVKVPYSSDLTVAQTPSVIVADHATLLTTGAQDFTSPVTYTVQAEDGTTKSYVVTVTKAVADTVCTIKTFSLNVSNEKVTISNASDKITVILPTGSTLTGITPTYTLTSSLSSITAPTFPANFSDLSNPVNITVTSESGKTKTYKVIIVEDATAPELSSSTPKDNATGASLAGVVTLNYTDDYSIALTLVDASKITISGGTGSLGTVSVSGLVASIHFSGLSAQTTYTLKIGAGAFSDAYGNLTSDTTITFTTADGVNKTLPYVSYMDGSNFSLPAFITDPTKYDATADTKATVTTQYGAYKLNPGDTLWINTQSIGSIYANIYALGINRYYSVGNSVNANVTTDTITYYSIKGISIVQKIDYTGTSTTPAKVYITNSITSSGAIYIPYIYLSAVGVDPLTEKEVWCTSN